MGRISQIKDGNRTFPAQDMNTDLCASPQLQFPHISRKYILTYAENQPLTFSKIKLFSKLFISFSSQNFKYSFLIGQMAGNDLWL